jgi:hypothetical protein
MARN